MPRKVFIPDDVRSHFAVALAFEGTRYDALAKDAAISMVRAFNEPKNLDGGMYSQDANKFRVLAAKHLLRAETFRAAAAIVAGKGAA